MFAISLLCIWYVKTYENQMLGGETQIIAVNQSKVDIVQEFETIAEKSQVTFAKQIFVSNQNEKGQSAGENTFAQIGNGKLPVTLKKQTDPEVIKRSPNNVLYVLIGNGISVKNVVQELNAKGNQTEVFDNNWSFALANNFLKSILAVGVLILLASYAALLLAEFVEGIKRSGIYRISGNSKHNLAFRGILSESTFIFGSMFLMGAGSYLYLFLNGYVSKQVLELITVTFLIWALILFVSYAFLSLVIFYVLQHQTIDLSIKGKAPMKAVVIMVVVFQLFSIIASMLSFNFFQDTNLQLQRLKAGENKWHQSKDYYALTSIGGFDKPNYVNLKNFLAEVLDNPKTLLAENQFANQEFNHGQKNVAGYFPTQYADENILYVNPTFIEQSRLSISQEVKEKIKHLEHGQYALLIPESHKTQASEISKVWQEWIVGFNQESIKKQIKQPINFKQVTGEYKDDKELFVYSVKGVTQVSNRNFVSSPLLMVYNADSFFESEEVFLRIFEQMIPQILVKNQEFTEALIRKYKLENDIGSFENGYSALLSRIIQNENVRNFALATNFLSAISSFLLVYLLNTIYFYQNRRKFLIERLAGKSFFIIHRKYLGVVIAAVFSISVVTSFGLHFSLSTLIVPLVYLIVIMLMFGFQLRGSERNNILYLKGE